MAAERTGVLRNVEFTRIRGQTTKAAFLLHQAAERYYHCVLLVCQLYTPHVHNLGFLRTQAERLDTRLVDVWPRATKTDRMLREAKRILCEGALFERFSYQRG